MIFFSVKKFWSWGGVKNFWSLSFAQIDDLRPPSAREQSKMGGVPGVSRACDRFPSKFQNFERHCRNSSLFLVKCGFTAVALKILKTCMGAYRSLFLIEMSNAARNFSIEDGVYVARSQKSLKVGEKISVEKWKIMVLSK